MKTSLLLRTALFRGITEDEAASMLDCLGAFEKQYEKGGAIFRAGETTQNIGLVLSGSVNIESGDVWGNRSILGRAEVGQIFAETYACIPGEPLLVSAAAAERCEILFLNASRLLTTCSSSCPCHSRLIRNLLQLTAQKNLALSRRILHTSSKTIRGRLLSYLSEQAQVNGGLRFSIPFNRQQLADYLNVDRSAMSAELSKMRAEGLIACDKNSFVLLQPLAE